MIVANANAERNSIIKSFSDGGTQCTLFVSAIGEERRANRGLQ